MGLILPLTIPKSVWQNENGTPKEDQEIPSGLYRAHFDAPDWIIELALIARDGVLGTTVNYQTSQYTLTDIKKVGDGKLYMEFYADSLVGGILVLAGIIGVGVTGAVVLTKLQKVIEVSYPLIIGAGALLVFSPKLRKAVL